MGDTQCRPYILVDLCDIRHTLVLVRLLCQALDSTLTIGEPAFIFRH